MATSIDGYRIFIRISDPWDFVTHNGQVRSGTVITDLTIPEDMIAIKLDIVLNGAGTVVEKVFAHYRHEDNSTSDLMRGMEVPCNFSSEIMNGTLSAACGAIAFIGSLKLVGGGVLHGPKPPSY